MQENILGTTLELLSISDLAILNIILYSSLDSLKCYSSINNSSNKASKSILVTNYD